MQDDDIQCTPDNLINCKILIVTSPSFYKMRKDVGTECRHDMWPSVQLLIVSRTHSNLGLTIMVRSSLQLAPELPVPS